MTISGNFVYPAAEVSEIDTLAMQLSGIPGLVLMRQAADFAYEKAIEFYPDTASIIVICGLGNNAGDGYLFAVRALNEGKKVHVVSLSSKDKLKGDALQAYKEYTEMNGEFIPWDQSLNFSADLIVDAIFGIGLNRSVEGIFLECIQTINHSSIPILSLDIPSGLNADTGEKMGDSISAQVTTTFVGYKQGLFLNAGPECSGEVFFSNLNIPEECYKSAVPSLTFVTEELSKKVLTKRPLASHKGNFGHILVVGGNHGMGGAVRIAAEAALRSGAGLVSVATRKSNVPIVAKLRPEVMCHSLDNNVDKIDDLIAKATVIAVGPGLGLDDWAKHLFGRVLESDLPLVVDADALNILSRNPRNRENWILTPHPGEAGRLLGVINPVIQSQRLDSLDKLVKKFGGTVVLKGSNTLVGGSNQIPYLVRSGNPGMASAGMGDLLTGVIAGLLGQFENTDYQLLAAIAANVHATAGDLAVEDGERGLIATDLFKYLKQQLNP